MLDGVSARHPRMGGSGQGGGTALDASRVTNELPEAGFPPNPPALPMPPRVLGDRGPRDRGPVLLCTGGVHGNEPAGVLALQRIFGRLEEGDVALAGRFVALAGNRGALAAGQRYLDNDLNRAFKPERVARVAGSAHNESAEDGELRDLVRLLAEVRAAAGGRSVHLLDIHSTSGGGAPFSVLDDTLANRAFGFAIPVPHVLGLEEELAGTVTSWANAQGLVATAFESGQHADPASVDRAEAAVWLALDASGVLPAGRREAPAARDLLTAQTASLPRVVEVRYRHVLPAGHRFRMEPGYRNFDAVRAGQLLATDGGAPVALDYDARLLMPLYQAKGDEGFFVVHDLKPVWLTLSAWLRRLGLDGLLHWLPGVSRHPEQAHTLVIDKRRARWLALEIFHLLGYRRTQRDEHTLVMTRRERR